MTRVTRTRGSGIPVMGIAFAALVCGSLGAGPARAEGTSRALLIGIESYADLGEGWWNLDGPANDIALLRSVLIDNLGFASKNVCVLQDRDATRAAIVKAVDRLTRETGKGDLVYIHFSGHGSQVPDRNGDEGGRRKDSTLVPIDGWGDGAYQILDDEIFLWIDRLLQKTPNVVFVADACHSGTITRGARSLKVRGVSLVDARDYAWSDTLRTAIDQARARDLSASRMIRASACRDDQEAHEVEAPDGKIYGLFTWSWCAALAQAADDASYADVFRSVEARLFREKGPRQTPQLEGASERFVHPRDRAGTRGVSAGRRAAVLRVQPDGITLGGGLLMDVTPGSVFERILPATVAGSVPPRLEIVSATTTEATARTVGSTAIQAGDVFVETEHLPSFPPFQVRIESESGGERWEQELRTALDGLPEIALTESRVPDVLLAVRRRGGGWSCSLLDAGEAPWGQGRVETGRLTLALEGEDGPRRVRKNLKRLIENENLLRISDAYQDSVPKVRVEIVRLTERTGKESRQGLTCTAGQPSAFPCDLCMQRIPVATGTSRDESAHLPNSSLVSFLVRNPTPRTLYAYAVNMTPKGEGALLSAPGGEPAFVIPPLDSLALETATRVLEDPGLVDTYLVFLTDSPLPRWTPELPALLTDADPPGAITRGSDADPGLTKLLDLARHPGQRGAASTETGARILAARRFSVLVGM